MPLDDVPPSIPADARLSTEEVNRLVDVALFRLRKERGKQGIYFGERTLFVEVLGDCEKTQEILNHFLHHVQDCPPEIIRYCRYIAAGRSATTSPVLP